MRGDFTLYFVRHGETDWNAVRRLQGQTDIALNANGRAQAARNGRTLKTLVADPAAVTFVASPLSRTRETMEIARAEIGLERTGFVTDDRLKEINFGHWEGITWGEAPAYDPLGFKAREADAFGWRPHGGESYGDLMDRAVSWLKSLERDTVVVSHGGVMRVLRGYLLGLNPREIPDLNVPQDKVLVLKRGHMEWY